MPRIFPVSLLILAAAASSAHAAGLDIQNQLLDNEISKLTAEADQKMNDLNSCSKSVNGFRIAGIATLTATAGLGILDIVQHNKINALNDKIAAADQSIAATDKKINAKQAELDQQRQQQVAQQQQMNAQMMTYYQMIGSAPTPAQITTAQTNQTNAAQLVVTATNATNAANQTLTNLNQRQADLTAQTNIVQNDADDAAKAAAAEKAKADQLATDAAKKKQDADALADANARAEAQRAADDAAKAAAAERAKADQLAADAAKKKQDAEAAAQLAKAESDRIAAERAAAAKQLADAHQAANDAAAKKAAADAEAARLAKQKADADAAKAALGTSDHPTQLQEVTVTGQDLRKPMTITPLNVPSPDLTAPTLTSPFDVSNMTDKQKKAALDQMNKNQAQSLKTMHDADMADLKQTQSDLKDKQKTVSGVKSGITEGIRQDEGILLDDLLAQQSSQDIMFVNKLTPEERYAVRVRLAARYASQKEFMDDLNAKIADIKAQRKENNQQQKDATAQYKIAQAKNDADQKMNASKISMSNLNQFTLSANPTESEINRGLALVNKANSDLDNLYDIVDQQYQLGNTALLNDADKTYFRTIQSQVTVNRNTVDIKKQQLDQALSALKKQQAIDAANQLKQKTATDAKNALSL